MGLLDQLLSMLGLDSRQQDEYVETRPVVAEVETEEQNYAPENVPEPDYTDLDHISELRPGQVHLHGNFSQVTSHYARKGLLVTNAIFNDGTGSVRVVWFNANVARLIRTDTIYELRGKFELKRSAFQISSPKFHRLDEGCDSLKLEVNEPEPEPELETTPPQENLWTVPINGNRLSDDSSWRALKTKVLKRDNYTCVICGANTNLQVDHKLELSLGGTNAMSNLQTLCIFCHEDKHYRNFLDKKFDAIDDYGKNYEPTIKIKALSSAMKKGNGVRISYTDRDGKNTRRTIRPKKIYKGYHYNGKIVNKSKVYVDAFCELDNAGRTFRVSRMKLVRPEQ